MTATVTTDVDDGIAVVTLSRPDVSNAVNHALRRALTAALRAADHNELVSAVVLTGKGRSFCAGQDLHEAANMATCDVPDWQRQQRDMYQAVRNLDKPCVAALNGSAAGAGFQIALCADIRVTHAGARLGQPEIKAGFASIVGSYLMSLHLGLSQNTRLSLTGELISASEAHDLGLVHHLVEPEEVLPTARDVARRLADQPREALRLSKRRFREVTQSGFDDACAAGARYQTQLFATGEPQRVMRRRLSGGA
jgi:enoyl-CoA hydratase/carnithine racemase